MITLAFLAALAAIVVVVLATEASEGDALRWRRPTGLITWIASGNWPAKIGGALIIVGVGALLRYSLIHIEVPPQLKLGAGIVIALLLGLASTFVPAGAAKRPVSLALGGAAFGVAYLTAYSAFALFHYLSNPAGLALLGVTAVAGGIYAVTRSALSLAVLSMAGAFLAPAFAVTDPGPLVVYGYYVVASLLTLGMVTMRGWRPLIHLSFLFTLAGGLFFAWTAKYYETAHADVMLPMLWVLAAIHVAMPICESRSENGRWMARLDVAYLLALPIASAVLALIIAPSRLDLSIELIVLSGIWAIATVTLTALRRNGAAAHAAIGAALLLLAIAARFRDLPWELIGLALAVGALAVAAWRRPLGRIHDVLVGIVLLFGALHLVSSPVSVSSGTALDVAVLVKRLIAATLLLTAGAICRRIRQPLDTFLLAAGILWAFIAVGIELVRLHFATFSLLLHWFFLLVAASLWIRGRRMRIADQRIVLLVVLIVATAVWSAFSASALAATVSLFAAALALVGVALRPQSDDEKDSRSERFAAAIAVPVVAAIWALRAGVEADLAYPVAFSLACAVAFAVVTLAFGRLIDDERSEWMDDAVDVFPVGFATILGGATLLFIVRDPSAVALEALCLAGLVLTTDIRRRLDKFIELSAMACIAGAALVLQANLMRVLGPPGEMNITDVLTLDWPAVISLLWAVVGSVLTIWSRKIGSRVGWMSGAVLLVAAAVKLLLLDFGSLGQLANILAVIAAGGVFLAVGWLSPMPPARAKGPPASGPMDRPGSPAGFDGGSRTSAAAAASARGPGAASVAGTRSEYNGWTIAGIAAAGAMILFQCHGLLSLHRSSTGHADERHEVHSVAASPAVIEPAVQAQFDADYAAMEVRDETPAETPVETLIEAPIATSSATLVDVPAPGPPQ